MTWNMRLAKTTAPVSLLNGSFGIDWQMEHLLVASIPGRATALLLTFGVQLTTSSLSFPDNTDFLCDSFMLRCVGRLYTSTSAWAPKPHSETRFMDDTKRSVGPPTGLGSLSQKTQAPAWASQMTPQLRLASQMPTPLLSTPRPRQTVSPSLPAALAPLLSH